MFIVQECGRKCSKIPSIFTKKSHTEVYGCKSVPLYLHQIKSYAEVYSSKHSVFVQKSHAELESPTQYGCV